MLPAMMQATSRDSLAALRTDVEQTLAPLDTSGATQASSDLAQVVRLLVSEPATRRALTDPSAEASGRAQLAERLFGGRVSTAARDLVVATARADWSTTGDLVDAINDLSQLAAFIGAEKDGSFAAVEEDLFRFGRVLDSDGELEQVLSDGGAPLDRRDQLLGGLVDRKVSPIAGDLLHGVLANPREKSMYDGVQGLVEAAAKRRRRSVAVVKSPVALTEQQEQRLTSSLSRIYGRDIAVSVDVDPAVQGGLRVQVGDDVIDGSIAGRIDDIQRRFAG